MDNIDTIIRNRSKFIKIGSPQLCSLNPMDLQESFQTSSVVQDCTMLFLIVFREPFRA